MAFTEENKKEKITRRPKTDISTMVYGKLPPHAKEMEEAILGACMLQLDAFDRTTEFLKPESFYVEAHQKIYRAIADMNRANRQVDILMLTEELRSREELEIIGGSYYVAKLTNAVVSAANIESHCRIVMQKYIQRQIIQIGGEMVAKGYEDSTDAFELLEEAEQLVGSIGMSLQFGEMVGIDNVLVDAVREIEKNRLNDNPITGIPSGFPTLDKATRGWQNTDLIILAARPSVGKTALALNLVRNAAKHFEILYQQTKKKKYVAMFSLEMKNVKLILRMLAAESKELLYRLQTGKLSEDQMRAIYKNGIQRLSGMFIRFDDRPGLTLPKLKSKCRRMARKGELGLVVIDYLQLIIPANLKATREQQVSEISRELKNLATELDVPIIALSQLSRSVESRKGADRMPQLSDLRESGAIEQDADVVMFLWAPDDEEVKENIAMKTTRYLRIAKQRDGFLTKVELDFRDEIQHFEEPGITLPPLPADLPAGNWKQVPTENDELPFK